MDLQVLQWLHSNIGREFISPRNDIFGRRPLNFKIIEVNENSKLVRITFIGGSSNPLPLHFWMFDRTLIYLRNNPNQSFPIGARLQPPYPKDSVEGEIWKEPLLYSSPYKSSPHILDILVYAGMVEFTWVRSRETGRRVQGVKFNLKGQPPYPVEDSKLNVDTHLEYKYKPDPNPKQKFFSKYRETIEKWTEENKAGIIDNRLKYSWDTKNRFVCENERNQVARSITQSRIRNGGPIDLETLDKVIKWGFNRPYPCRDPEKALETTGKAFNYLDKGDVKQATLVLLETKYVGISRASKILGLSDQENLCIYDSRVGTALQTLFHEGKPLIPTPPSQVRDYDSNIPKKGWAEHYERLIWTAEVIKNYMNVQGCTYRLADVEMALFMMGK